MPGAIESSKDQVASYILVQPREDSPTPQKKVDAQLETVALPHAVEESNDVPWTLHDVPSKESQFGKPVMSQDTAVPVPPAEEGPEFLRKRSFVGTDDSATTASDNTHAMPRNPRVSTDSIDSEGGARKSRASGIVAAARRRTSVKGDAEDLKKAQKAMEQRKKRNSVASLFEVSAIDRPEWKKQLQSAIDGPYISTFMTIITIWALFGDDIRLLATDKDADSGFEVVTIICLICFTIELVCLSLSKPGYSLGFYFWLDFVATASLILDIEAVYNAFFGGEGEDDGASNAALAKTGRTGRAGSKAGRIVRLVRLVRIVKLYKQYQQRREAALRGEEDMADIIDDDEEELGEESRVGQKLSDMITRKVIIGVLGMIFLLPVFDIEGGYLASSPAITTTEFGAGGLDVLHFQYVNNIETNEYVGPCSSPGVGGIGNVTCDPYVTSTLMKGTKKFLDISSSGMSHADLYYLSIGAWTVKNDKKTLRKDEKESFVVSTPVPSVKYCNDACLDFPSPAEAESTADPLCEKVCGNEGSPAGWCYEGVSEPNSGNCVSKCVDAGNDRSMCDAKCDFCVVASVVRYNIQDESRLIATLNIFRTIFICIVLGMGAMLFSKDANELVLGPIEKMVKFVREIAENPLGAGKGGRKKVNPEEDKSNLETRVLETSIAKICSLLALGFGDAGAEIISENMKNGGDLDPMVPGRKMVAIFGFCDIRQFTDSTEVLQEGIMEYVNTIGKIVHQEVALHDGSANKNIGDAFLLVWKFDPMITVEDLQNPEALKGEKRIEVERVADKALASFITIMACLKKSAKLKEYRLDPRLNERMPGFRTKMGFGLHVGWAIEGAIGSEYKVDASYLSPNVNMASRLEAATKQFRTPILISEDFASILSPDVRRKCRQIDRVTVKGSIKPMGLLTFDVDDQKIPDPDISQGVYSSAEDETLSFDVDKKYRAEFEEHPDITNVHAVDDAYLRKFEEGYRAYEDGKWDLAKEIITACQKRNDVLGQPTEDGPSTSLLEVMAAHNFKAPEGWNGFRELTEK